MDSDQTPINGKPRRQRMLPVVAEDVVLAFEEKVVWRVGDGLKAIFEVVRWPFERLGWALQRSLLWPLQDRVGELNGRGRAVAAGGGVAAIAVGVAALVLATSGGSGAATETTVAVAPEPVAKVSPAPVTEKPAPTLHGAAPVFKPAKAKGSSAVDPAKQIESSSAESSGAATGSPAATGKISSSPNSSSSSGSAQVSTVDGPAAGKQAIAVARDFSGAFVVYETGGEEAAVRKTFATTTTPELAKALLKRPPRLPANVKVPKAKVVNVVAGPSQGGVYSLSVSLLRLGVTSELRIEMEKLKGEGWRVTNVLG
jgi:hypothetical protein